jgi:hypothetical protein
MKLTKTPGKIKWLIIGLIIISGCSGSISVSEKTGTPASIFPEYIDVTFPPNIAPADFYINEKAEKFVVKIHSPDRDEIKIVSRNGMVRIPQRKWERLLTASKGGDIQIDIFARSKKKWVAFKSITNHIAEEPVDKYLVYRLIEPGFETWNRMGIYQRNLENFEEDPVMMNDISDGNCINCHAFSSNRGNTMMFHMRAQHAGTIIYRNGEISKIDTKTEKTISAGVYPSWHPDERYIAYSVNRIVQMFHSVPGRKIDVIDTLSDIVILDLKTNTISTCDALSTKENFETFPSWSPDGRYLYYCSAKIIPLSRYDEIRYDLLRIQFDPESKQFGSVDTVVAVAYQGKSISFPRVSPDGKYVLFCMSDFGNFSIWHPESDLYLKNLQTGELSRLNINSPMSESYHTWSSSGKWIVFSSRRLDGLFTRPFFSYFDSSGVAHKPFILPQRNPLFYNTFIKSYNIPELVTSKIRLNPGKLSRFIDSDAIPVSFKDQ